MSNIPIDLPPMPTEQEDFAGLKSGAVPSALDHEPDSSGKLLSWRHHIWKNPLPLASSSAEVAQAMNEMAAYFDKRGWVGATAGNISCRLTTSSDGIQRMAMTATGTWKGLLVPDDILEIDFEGNLIDSSACTVSKKPSTETPLHAVVYSMIPSSRCIAHVHSSNAAVLSRLALKRSGRPKQVVLGVSGYSYLKAFQNGKDGKGRLFVPIFDDHLPWPELVTLVSAYLEKHPSCLSFILDGHGQFTWGRDLEETQRHTESLEQVLEMEKLRLLLDSTESLDLYRCDAK